MRYRNLTLVIVFATLAAVATPALAAEPQEALADAVLVFHAPQGTAGDLRASQGVLLMKVVDSPWLKARRMSSSEGDLLIDVSPFVGMDTRTGARREPDGAASLTTGFAVWGGTHPAEGDTYETIVFYDDAGKPVREVRVSQWGRNGQPIDPCDGCFSIHDLTQLPDGDLAVFWSGYRTDRYHVQMGVMIADGNLNLKKDVYGPVTLSSRYLPVYSWYRDNATGVRWWDNRLFILNAYTNELVVADKEGNIVARHSISNPEKPGDPFLMAGWSIEPTGVWIDFALPVDFDPQNPGEKVAHSKRMLVKYGWDGAIKAKRTGVSFRMIRPTDDGRTLVFAGPDVWAGHLR